MPNPKSLNVKSLGNVRLDWRGDQVIADVRRNMAQAMGEIGLRVEAESKKELYKGHGVLTGTLRRSIHAAQPGYSWASDDVAPAAGTPERGGQMALGITMSDAIVVQVGSGLNYALPVHQGFGGFEGYHYLRNGVRNVKPQIPAVLEKHKVGIKK